MDKLKDLTDNQKKIGMAAAGVAIIAAGMYFMSKSKTSASAADTARGEEIEISGVKIRSINGKYTVDVTSAPAVVKKIAEIKKQFPDNCMAQAFDESYYNNLNDDQKIRLLTCCLSGVANPDSCMGCYAMNPKDYDEFSNFFKKALEQYHRVDLSVKKHVNNWSLEGVKGLPADGILDLTKLGLPALSMRVRTGRNLNKYPLPGAMTKEDRINME